MAAGHSVEVDRWQGEFGALLTRIGSRFARVEPRRRVAAFVQGLLAGLPRANCWTIAEHAAELGPQGCNVCCRGRCGTPTGCGMTYASTWSSTWRSRAPAIDRPGRLIPLTRNEIRRLFTGFLARPLPARLRLHWSRWRRRHQAIARASHYKHRQALVT